MKRLATLITGGILVLGLSGCAVGGALFKVVFLRNGAPSGGEIRRMEERERGMLQALPEVTILVIPVGMLTREGASCRADVAELLAARLRKAGYPGARAGGRAYGLPYPRGANQAWLYWKRFRALGDSVRAAPPGEADYVLLVDIMGSTNDDGSLRGVGGIHIYSSEEDGDLAYGRLRNSMHRIWKEMPLHSMSDVCDLVVRDLTDARREVFGG